jgi:nucleotide-binding universal stress UspA family protein
LPIFESPRIVPSRGEQPAPVEEANAEETPYGPEITPDGWFVHPLRRRDFFHCPSDQSHTSTVSSSPVPETLSPMTRKNAAVLGTIVVGYDGTQAAERALERAAELAQAFDAAIVVADVAAPEPLAAEPGGFGLMPYYVYAPAHTPAPDEALWQQHRARIASLLGRSGTRYEFAAAVGDPIGEILDIAERHGADLIVVGTREAGLLTRLLEGSVSQGVARRAACDVLIVHPPHDPAAER